jgi:hypothetical protein
VMKCLCAAEAATVKCVLRKNSNVYTIPWPTDLSRKVWVI